MVDTSGIELRDPLHSVVCDRPNLAKQLRAPHESRLVANNEAGPTVVTSCGSKIRQAFGKMVGVDVDNNRHAPAPSARRGIWGQYFESAPPSTLRSDPVIIIESSEARKTSGAT